MWPFVTRKGPRQLPRGRRERRRLPDRISALLLVIRGHQRSSLPDGISAAREAAAARPLRVHAARQPWSLRSRHCLSHRPLVEVSTVSQSVSSRSPRAHSTVPSSRSLREKQLDSRSCVSLRQRATWSWSTSSAVRLLLVLPWLWRFPAPSPSEPAPSRAHPPRPPWRFPAEQRKPAHRRCMLRHYVHNYKQMQLGF